VNAAELSFIQKDRAPAPHWVQTWKILRSGRGCFPLYISWRSILTSKSILAVTASYFCFGYVAWIFFSWFTSIWPKCAVGHQGQRAL